MGRSAQKVIMGKLLLALGIVSLTSCAATKESEDDSQKRDVLKQYEATFRPSDYDQPLKDFFPEIKNPTSKDTTAGSISLNPQALELTQGYRVQIFATTNHDEAEQMKATAETQFPEEWFYVVYDAPTYKLRAGNFLERYEADRFGKSLAEKGYRDAWVVPEKVFKNAPPRPPQAPDQQK
ncbi:MAG TPA: hypothetical protein DGH68_04770 [Bacteroidetes bacterium]|jgi:hypothetical protein|nr:hypothetical protein [Bacteroidota bacterium]